MRLSLVTCRKQKPGRARDSDHDEAVTSLLFTLRKRRGSAKRDRSNAGVKLNRKEESLCAAPYLARLQATVRRTDAR